MQVTTKEYWNNVERAIANTANGKFSDNFGKRRVLVEALLKYNLTDSRIVELGSGLGLTAYAVALVTGRLVYSGVDISENYAAAAKRFFDLRVVVHDITESLPFKDESADCIFAFDTLEHIPPEARPKLYQEIDRILSAQDRVIFINNPLSESQHDPAFDFSFNETDIVELAKATKTRIIECKLLMSGNSVYQFIVLGSVR